MGMINLEKSPLADVTVISNVFLDKYMPQANGEFVKIYLYVLRCSEKSEASLTLNKIADVMNHTETDVMRALKYWEQSGILGLDYDSEGSLNRITIKDLRQDIPLTFKIIPEGNDNVSEVNAEPSVSMLKSRVSASSAKSLLTPHSGSIPEKREFSNEEISAYASDESFKELIYVCQTYLGKGQLSQSDVNTLMYFHDGLNFSIDLIEHLVTYCVNSGHKSMRYIEKTALNWAEEGISSVDEAKNYVSAYSNSCYPVLNAFGITGRNPAASEKAYILKWTGEYGFSMDMILEACNRTIDNIHKPSFQYADSILLRWHNQNIKCLEDLKELDAVHEAKAQKTAVTKSAGKNSFNSFPQRDYDYDSLERDLLRRR